MSRYVFYPLRKHPHYGHFLGPDNIPNAAIFIPHNGFSKYITSTKLDQFAEYLSEGLSVTQAAQRMGKDYSYGNAMLQRIRRRLGAQAR